MRDIRKSRVLMRSTRATLSSARLTLEVASDLGSASTTTRCCTPKWSMRGRSGLAMGVWTWSLQ